MSLILGATYILPFFHILAQLNEMNKVTDETEKDRGRQIDRQRKTVEMIMIEK